MRVLLGAVCLVMLAGSVSASDADTIRAFLAVPAEERLSAALDSGDRRYLGVYGFSLEVPGISDPASPWPSSRVLPIPGTSDSGDFELNQSARDYATQYNTLLRARLSPTGQ